MEFFFIEILFITPYYFNREDEISRVLTVEFLYYSYLTLLLLTSPRVSLSEGDVHVGKAEGTCIIG